MVNGGSAVDPFWGPNDLHTFCHSRDVRVGITDINISIYGPDYGP